jgi:hypothetical protein
MLSVHVGYGICDFNAVDIVDGLVDIIGRKFWMNNVVASSVGYAYYRANRKTIASRVVAVPIIAITEEKVAGIV